MDHFGSPYSNQFYNRWFKEQHFTCKEQSQVSETTDLTNCQNQILTKTATVVTLQVLNIVCKNRAVKPLWHYEQNQPQASEIS